MHDAQTVLHHVRQYGICGLHCRFALEQQLTLTHCHFPNISKLPAQQPKLPRKAYLQSHSTESSSSQVSHALVIDQRCKVGVRQYPEHAALGKPAHSCISTQHGMGCALHTCVTGIAEWHRSQEARLQRDGSSSPVQIAISEGGRALVKCVPS